MERRASPLRRRKGGTGASAPRLPRREQGRTGRARDAGDKVRAGGLQWWDACTDGASHTYI
ncbi:hypothetical protein ANANG_G00029900 [Anguilla anguilla]|uniref:Uncharacterized protein n=1 Tax=Anguilla anguilla TaxID=7936 RepID=A0A9D3S3W0_ANGAN|nr:hypothetical protein ANANG_G00029900 [Anguilla anguilla]